jgi:aspartate racemase
LASRAREVEAAGADFLLLCTNTMHRVANVIEDAVSIPMLHLADATAQRIAADRHARVGLLGTRFTMEQPFYRERLEAAGLEVLVPDAAGREQVHRIIYDELCQGEIRPESRERYQSVVNGLKAAGADCIIAGCTEITLLLKPDDCALPLYDTAQIHALAAVDRALA